MKRKPSPWRNAITRYADEDPASLLANPANWRTHPQAQTAALTGSLTELGWIAPVIVNETTQHVVDGHARIGEAIARGEATVPVAYVNLTEDQERLALASFDPIGALAGRDDAQLTALLDGLLVSDAGLADMLRDLAPVVPKVLHEDDADLTPPAEPITKTGDLWLLGEHRLLCGDSTRAEDVQWLMAGERAKLMATDPPYAVGYSGGEHPRSPSNSPLTRNKQWDDYQDVAPELFGRFLKAAYAEALTEDAAIYQWYAFSRHTLVEAAWRDAGLLPHQQIIWVKSRPVLTRSHFMWQHEPCFYGWLQGHQPADRPPANITSVWHVDLKGEGDDVHPTQKPLALFNGPFEWHLAAGGLAYEPFSGSGTCIVVAEQTGRRCFAMELAPAFCDVSVRRWENLTGRKAVRDGKAALAS